MSPVFGGRDKSNAFCGGAKPGILQRDFQKSLTVTLF